MGMAGPPPGETTPPRGASSRWVALMPTAFVVLWSTGFIGAKLGLPHAEPFTFLLLRFLCVSAILTAAAFAIGAPWPSEPRQIGRTVAAGLMIHGLYLGGVFSAIAHGVPAGITALIVGLQPLLTAAVSPAYLGERITARQWWGLGLRFCRGGAGGHRQARHGRRRRRRDDVGLGGAARDHRRHPLSEAPRRQHAPLHRLGGAVRRLRRGLPARRR